jgi:hypothetical protein
VGAESFHADKRINVRKIAVIFRNFANAPKNCCTDLAKSFYLVNSTALYYQQLYIHTDHRVTQAYQNRKSKYSWAYNQRSHGKTRRLLPHPSITWITTVRTASRSECFIPEEKSVGIHLLERLMSHNGNTDSPQPK